ncbi:minor tail protein [Microbacterium phage FireCastle]
MQLNDLTLEVRDRTLKRVGQVTPAYMDLTARTRWCGVGEWKVTLPGDHPMVPELAKPGSGILLLGPDGTDVNTILSGPTRNPLKVRNAQNPDGTHTFSGVTDEILLQGASAFPDPSIADPQASSKSRTNDVRTDNTESLLRQYTAFNIANGAMAGGPSWAPTGRLRGLRAKTILRGSSQSRGLAQKKSPRFQNLLELLQEIVAYDPSLGFRMVQINGLINFEVLDARDRTKFVRFDVENGTITSEETQSSGPSVTDAIVLGQGEGKDRQIVRRQTTASIAAEETWGIPFELVIDQRDTDDPVELQQSGDEKLLEGMGGTAVKMIPADDTTMQVGKDWRAGDSVTTVVDGIETVARVTEVAYMANKTGVRAGAALGDVSGFSQANTQAAAVKSLDSRMSHLERTGGLLPARLGVNLIGNSPSGNADDLIENGKYWVSPGAGANTPDTTLNWEIRTTAALLGSGSLSIYQEAWRFVDTYGSDRYSRVRTAGVWSAWKVLGLRTRNFVPVSGVSTFVVGNGTIGGTYSVNDGLLAGIISVTLGTTSAITGDIQFELPMPYSGSTREAGVGRITDASTGANYNGAVLVNSSRLYVRPFGMTQAASGDGFLREYSASSIRPITWEAGDGIVASFVYPIL